MRSINETVVLKYETITVTRNIIKTNHVRIVYNYHIFQYCQHFFYGQLKWPLFSIVTLLRHSSTIMWLYEN